MSLQERNLCHEFSSRANMIPIILIKNKNNTRVAKDVNTFVTKKYYIACNLVLLYCHMTNFKKKKFKTKFQKKQQKTKINRKKANFFKNPPKKLSTS